MNVGDIFVSIRGDGTKLPKDATDAATKAGDAAGKTFSDRFNAATRAGFTALTAGAGAVFAGLTKVAGDGQNAMAKFRAETGATQQEAEDALAAMDRLAGRNLQSFETVSETLTQVRTQMGLTGDEAERMADRILSWSTATGQDAVSAVKAFDDAADAWNLTTEQTVELMDQLIVSHQRYGGSVEESEGLLNNLAPALQAANISWQDAVGLLNLFNRAGVGAEAAATGFTRVLTKVKSPEEMRALVADIASTSDAFERGQKAADAFGSRAGPKLALALADSGGDLSKFGISAEDAAGAVDRAAQAIEDTLPNKVKMAVNGALASLRDLGTDFGPALTGSAALVSLGSSFASALKLDTAISSAVRTAWQKVAVDTGVLNAVTAAGSKWGPLILRGIGVLAIPFALQPLGEAVAPTEQRQLAILTDPLARAAYAQAQAIGDDAANAFLDAMTQAFREGRSKAEAIAAGTAAADAIHDAITGAPYDVNPMTEAEKLAAYYKLVQENASRIVASDHSGSFRGGLGMFGLTADTQAVVVAKVLGIWNEIQALAGPSGNSIGASAGAGIANGFGGQIPSIAQQGGKAGHETGVAFSEGLTETKGDVASAMAELRDALEHPLRGIKTVAKIEGALTSKALREGLASEDPYTRAKAEETRDMLIAKLRELQKAGYDIGKKGMKLLGDGIGDGTPQATDDAKEAKQDVHDALVNANGYYEGGQAIGNAWAKGLAAAIRSGVARAEDALRNYHGPMIGTSPPKTGPLRHIDVGGYNIGKAWRDAFVEGLGVGEVNSALSRIGFGASPWSPDFSSIGGAGGSGSLTVRHEFGTLRVDSPNLSPEAAAALGQGIGVGLGDVLDDVRRMRILPIGANG